MCSIETSLYCAGDLMDVDTVPIPEEELDSAIGKQVQAGIVSNQAIPEGLNTAPRPARPKAMTWTADASGTENISEPIYLVTTVRTFCNQHFWFWQSRGEK